MGNTASNGKMPTGVQIRSGKVRINFKRQGKRQWLTLPLEANAEGIKQAGRIRSDLAQKAKWGVLTQKDIDEAVGVKQEYSDTPLFQEYAQMFLNQSDASHNTKKEYKNALMRHWMPTLGLRPLHTITKTDIRNLVNSIEWASNKTRNNCLIPLRGVFDLAIEDEVIKTSPAEKIKNLKHQQEPPDPFSPEEMELILNDLKANTKGKYRVYYWYFELAFWTGLRTSELLALTWQDIDWVNRTIRISKAQSKGRLNSQTKTGKVRDVKFNSRSEHALNELKLITYVKQSNIFLSPRYGTPWQRDKPPRDQLIKSMRRCGVRHRPAYNTRHTYATMCLTAGISTFAVASQLGHSVVTLEKKYAKWIDADKLAAEMDKLDSLNVPKVCQRTPA